MFILRARSTAPQIRGTILPSVLLVMFVFDSSSYTTSFLSLILWLLTLGIPM
jgi:hypothetical protein